MNIAFVHAGMTQFKGIHDYINARTDSRSWLLCAEGVYNAYHQTTVNLVPFADPADDPETFFYIQVLESRLRRSFHIKAALLELMKEQPIDVVVVHGSGGWPIQLYDEIPAPIVAYVEFPSFRAHGYDPKYPPPEALVYRDKLFEMYSCYEAVKSDLVIVPSLYARSLFPEVLQPNVVAQMDGLDIETEPPPPFAPGRETFQIGFLARDLSSAKGVEHFVMVAKEIHRLRPHCRFLICGQKEVRYSYETDFLKSLGYPEGFHFLDYLFERENIDPADGVFRHVEFMDYGEYVSFLQQVDLVHYPLQFGSANWGLFECLFRGKKIVASNRCFVPEVITDGYNGLLRDYGDVEGWVGATLAVVDDPAAYDYMAQNAREDAYRRFHVSTVAERYLSILEEVVAAYQKAELAAEIERLAESRADRPAWMLPDVRSAGPEPDPAEEPASS